MDTKTFLQRLIELKNQTVAFFRSFALSFFTQVLALGVERLSEVRTYVISAGAALMTLIINYLNPKDKRFGVGSSEDARE